MQILDAPSPEQRAGHLHRASSKLEKVERNDPDGNSGEDRPGGRPERSRKLNAGTQAAQTAEVHPPSPVLTSSMSETWLVGWARPTMS